MQLRDSAALFGANIGAPTSAIRLVLDLASIPADDEEHGTGGLDRGIITRLQEALPRLGEDADALDALRASLEASTRQAVAQAVAAAAVGIQRHFFIEYEFAYARAWSQDEGAPKAGLYEVFFSFEFAQLGLRIGGLAAALVHSLLPEPLTAKAGRKKIDAPSQLQSIGEFVKKQISVRPRRRVSTVARRRGIPCHRYGVTPDFLLFGQGPYQKRTNLTITDNTSALCPAITANKILANKFLREMGIPVAKQVTLTSEEQGVKAAKAMGFPVVTKPRSGNRGRGVTANISSASEVRQGIRKAAQVHKQVILEEYLPGDDYRFVVINGELVSVIKRVNPHVIGDGKKNIRELIEHTNANRIGEDGWPRNLRVLKLDDEAARQLAKQNLGAESVPSAGQMVILSGAGNGGTTVDLTDQIHPDNAAAAIRAVEIMRIDVGGVDFLLPDPSKSYRETGGGICEVNYMPDIQVHLIAEGAHKSDMVGAFVRSLYRDDEACRVATVAMVGYDRDDHGDRIGAALEAAEWRPAVASARGIISDGWSITETRPDWKAATHRVLLDPVCDVAVLAPSLREVHDMGFGNETLDLLVIGADREDGPHEARTLARLIELAKMVVVEVDDQDEESEELFDGDGPEIPTQKLVIAAPSADYPIVKSHLAAGGRAVIADEGDESCTLHNADTSEQMPESGDDALAQAVARFLPRGARTPSGEVLST
jgi:cyanophycin synthetase